MTATACRTCGAEILLRTAERTHGLCMPCRKQEVRDDVGGTPFGQHFDRGFRDPDLGSDSYRSCWLSAKLTLAGPMWGTRETGSVESLFAGDERFPGVRDPESLKGWCLEVLRKLRACVEQHRAASPVEEADRRAIEAKATELEELVRLWHAFYVARHSSGHAAGGSAPEPK